MRVFSTLVFVRCELLFNWIFFRFPFAHLFVTFPLELQMFTCLICGELLHLVFPLFLISNRSSSSYNYFRSLIRWNVDGELTHQGQTNDFLVNYIFIDLIISTSSTVREPRRQLTTTEFTVLHCDLYVRHINSAGNSKCVQC